MTDILIIEDNPELGTLVRDFLCKNGWSAVLCADAESGLELLEKDEFRLILLDVMLPGMNGFETCTAVREKRDIPILMMSAQTDENSKLMGYETGADDYIDKPFSIPVLMAKIKALLRRSDTASNEKGDVISEYGVTIDRDARKVTLNGREVQMSAKEFDVLYYLMSHSGKAVSKDVLFDSVWGTDCFSEPSTVSVHIRWLREKLEADPKDPKLIQTVWKVGYRFGGGK